MATSFLKRNKRLLFRLILCILLLLPLWMWLAWLFTPKRQLVVAIIDKTVLTPEAREHISLDWVLAQERFAKNRHDLYRQNRDYYGFFPLPKDRFRLKGLERFDDERLQQLSKDADVAYITDAYGIYSNEWYRHVDEKERSGKVYGGMSPQDLAFLQMMQARHKLIVTEFNCIGSPTGDQLRAGFASSFGIYWSGWIGRYFDSFDTTRNKELPGWLIDHYKAQHGGAWPFTRAGIAFVHSDDRIVILEKDNGLQTEYPVIYNSEEARAHYGLPRRIPYTYWFDIVRIDTTKIRQIASYSIDPREKGRKEMQDAGIPLSFPAISMHQDSDYRFFYLSGDFCDNPIGLAASRFKGVGRLSWFMYNKRDPLDRTAFFWRVYRPLMTGILEDYYSAIHTGTANTHTATVKRS